MARSPDGNPTSPLCSRRHAMVGGAFGLASLGLADLLVRDGVLRAESAGPEKPSLEPIKHDLTPKNPHFRPRARAMISVFAVGGPSHVDLFDPKPKLREYDGKPYPAGNLHYDNAAQASTKVVNGPWAFRKRGRCGMEISDLLPGLAEIVDDICLIRSMNTGVNNHVPSLWALNTGKGVPGRPALGSWINYGLGSETRDLPSFVALTHPWGLPIVAGDNWASGFLPSIYQGTMIRPREPRIPDLDPPENLRGEPQARQLDLLRSLNRRHLAARPGETDLEARVASYELAARMQLAAREALDISRESAATRKLYGVDDPVTADYGARCLIARRLVERGVRFIQIWNSGQSWDHHSSILTELPARCREIDRPVAALVRDLKDRGMLDETLVHFGGEMGRLPVIQNDGPRDRIGRDHNTYGFSAWMAGGGVKGGHVHGATDEFGYKAVTDPVNPTDWLRTVTHLFGLDCDKLVFTRDNRKMNLVDGQPGKIIREILA